jgi:hypothetical protein
MTIKPYNELEIKSFSQTVLNDGFCVLPNYFSPATLNAWREAFAPLLNNHIEREGNLQNRGLPFTYSASHLPQTHFDCRGTALLCPYLLVR